MKTQRRRFETPAFSLFEIFHFLTVKASRGNVAFVLPFREANLRRGAAVCDLIPP